MHASVPQSDYGGIHPELAARITSARAAIGDFERESDTYINEGQEFRPDWSAWSFRLHAEAKHLVEILDRLVAYRPSGEAGEVGWKYRKTLVIEARQFPPLTPGWHGLDALSLQQLAAWCGGAVFSHPDRAEQYIVVPTLQGDMRAHPGDWIVRGAGGEHYPVKSEVFEQTYERVEQS